MDGALKAGPGQWSSYALDSLFAPELSRLSRNGATPIQGDPGDRDSWLRQYVLQATFRHPLRDPIRQLGFALLRRTDQAVREYGAGRMELEHYLREGKPTRLTHYSRALAHFEGCAAATCHAWSVARSMMPGKPKVFVRQDGSDLQRLWELYNASKHLEERLAKGEAAPEGTMHIWLTDDGLKSTQATVSFDELRLLIESLTRICVGLANPP